MRKEILGNRGSICICKSFYSPSLNVPMTAEDLCGTTNLAHGEL